MLWRRACLASWRHPDKVGTGSAASTSSCTTTGEGTRRLTPSQGARPQKTGWGRNAASSHPPECAPTMTIAFCRKNSETRCLSPLRSKVAKCRSANGVKVALNLPRDELQAKPALDCGSNNSRLPPSVHTAKARGAEWGKAVAAATAVQGASRKAILKRASGEQYRRQPGYLITGWEVRGGPRWRASKTADPQNRSALHPPETAISQTRKFSIDW